MTITEFLEARITEDEELANATIEDQKVRGWGDWREDTLREGHGMPATDLTAEFSPARVLAECAAKRAIMALHRPIIQLWWPEQCEVEVCEMCDEERWPCPTIQALAAVYASHPDYLQGWAL